jgi:hypothetical protein
MLAKDVSGMGLGVAPRTNTKETCVQKSSNHDDHLKLNSQHNCMDLYDHLMSTRVFTLIMNTIFK